MSRPSGDKQIAKWASNDFPPATEYYPPKEVFL